MRLTGQFHSILAALILALPAAAGDGNRLACPDGPCDPYYAGRKLPKLITPQWVGEPGVEAVVVLAVDDLRDTAAYEAFLRPILERLKRIDGRAALSLMTNQVDLRDPQLQAWLAEGLSLEAHTSLHRCPCLQGGDLAAVRQSYEDNLDLVASIPNNRPVAFRMPCCDSMSSVSPRYFAEVMFKTSPQGNFLSMDSSVFLLLTADDTALPRELVLEADGRERFRKYVPTDRVMANLIEDYPYPYAIGNLVWEIPPVMPSDWDAQHRHGVCNPATVADLKAAVDALVIKQGVFSICFHPHGWIRNDQIVDVIDHAVRKHGKKVKFLTFREVYDRLTKNLLGGHPLRAADGRVGNVRILDLDNDGYMDVAVNDPQTQWARVWSPKEGQWVVKPMPKQLSRVDRDDLRRLLDFNGDGVYEAILRRQGKDWLCRWTPDREAFRPLCPLPDGLLTLDADGRDTGLRLVDIDEDGRLDVVFSNHQRYSVHLFTSMKEGWSRCVLSGTRGDGNPNELPPIVRADGTNNGAWFARRHMWVQNEDTGAKLPGHVWSRHFTQLLDADHQPPPRSPEGSLRSMLPRPGFRVELVAAEPLVMDPIDVAWGPDGRLWVTEMADYPLGISEDGHIGLPDPMGQPGGRVRFLEDTNGDGKYDRSTVFLEPVAFPSGVIPWRRGVIVTAAPEIFYAEDTDGDGRADVHKTLFRGFGEGNQQHRVNHPRWGLDNWVHAANGDSGGAIRSMATGKEWDIGGRDVRFRPDAGALEPQTGQAQFGRNRDDWGNWFGCNNNNPGWHYVLADHYLRRNPHVAAPTGRLDLTASRNAYPGGRVVTHCFYDQPTPPEGQPGVWTSIGGVMIYRDELFGPAFAGNLFVGDSVYCVIHRMVLESDGVTFRGRRADDEQKLEFLASADPWFRPTTVRTGPDGALWVADMYRFVIEHPEWIDDRLEKTLPLRKGHDRGRIYRIYPIGKTPRPIPRLDQLDTAGLVAALEGPNGWQRDMAQQMLIWRADRAAVKPLEAMVLGGRRALARLHALCTLDGLGALRPEIAIKALADEHAGVRRHAVRLSAGVVNSHAAVGEALVELIDDPDPQVQMQLAYSLGQWRDPKAGRALGRLAVGHADDPYLSAAVMSSAAVHAKEMIAQVQVDPREVAARPQLLHKLLKLQDAVTADPDAEAGFEPIRVRAKKPLDDAESREKIRQSLDKFHAVVEMKDDPGRGKRVFVEATCSTCHRLDDVGTRIGPDIRTLIDRSPQNLLVAVIDPNRAFLDRYREYIALTTDGLQHSGMLMDETTGSILLVDVDGKHRVILRKDVEELVDTGRSHMPEGLEGKLDLPKMADLFAFVGGTAPSLRELAGNAPRMIRPAADGCLRLPAAAAEIYGEQITLEPKYGNLGWWSGEDAYAVWSIHIEQGGDYGVWLDWACADVAAGNKFLLRTDARTLAGKVPGTGTWDDYRQASFGQVTLSPGQSRLGFRSDGPISGALIDLRTIWLVPVGDEAKAPPEGPEGTASTSVEPE